jgi:hypothetical protein
LISRYSYRVVAIPAEAIPEAARRPAGRVCTGVKKLNAVRISIIDDQALRAVSGTERVSLGGGHARDQKAPRGAGNLKLRAVMRESRTYPHISYGADTHYLPPIDACPRIVNAYFQSVPRSWIVKIVSVSIDVIL